MELTHSANDISTNKSRVSAMAEQLGYGVKSIIMLRGTNSIYTFTVSIQPILPLVFQPDYLINNMYKNVGLFYILCIELLHKLVKLKSK